MSKHVIIGRFGSSDRESVAVISGEIPTSLPLLTSVGNLDHGMSQALVDLSRLGIHPSEVGVDLMVLASHIHAADTRISRQSESEDSWTREIRLVVPVSDVQIWEPTVPLLSHMLNFLTGDYWTVGFRLRPTRFATLTPPRQEQLGRIPFSTLALFSGGLDSLISAIDTIEGGDTTLFISHAGDPPTSHAQETCFDQLKRHYQGKSFERLYVWMNLPSELVRGVTPESTTRSRSFLFISLAVLASTGIPTDLRIRVPENGFMVLNVPLDPLRLGSFSTRTTHPFYLARWKELLDMLGLTATIDNPYMFKTKGEMIASCVNPDILRSMVANSISCSSPAKGRWHGRPIEHCGYCLPCLVRRAAIERAWGRGADPTTYSIRDLSARLLDTQSAEGRNIRSLQVAYARVRSKPDLAKILVHKPGSLSTLNAIQLHDIAEVYLRGLEEVGLFLSNVQARPT